MTSPEAEEQQFTLRIAAVSWRDVDGEIVALDLESGAYFALNGSGRLLWMALADRASTLELAGLLRDSFGVSNEQAKSDASAFLSDLVDRRLVEELV